jgi:carboxymethylenebutenolidase
MSQMLTYKRPDGKECSGFYVEPPAGVTAPAMVVIQEWWGLNDQIKGVANRLSAAGYRALIPDLYRGKVTLDAAEAEHLMNNLDYGNAATQDIRGAVQYLKSSGSRTGVTGFCMGGALSLLVAANVPDADAIVCWYGCPPLEYLDVNRIKAPLLGHFADHDAFFPPKLIDALDAKLNEAGVRHEFYRYDARHAFANETMTNTPLPLQYNPAAAETAWTRTFAFLKQHLEQAV